MRILVIEDNPKMAAGLQKGLREHGFAVDSTHMGFEGEDLAAFFEIYAEQLAVRSPVLFPRRGGCSAALLAWPETKKP